MSIVGQVSEQEEERRRRRGFWWWFAIVLALVLVGTGLFVFRADPGSVPPPVMLDHPANPTTTLVAEFVVIDAGSAGTAIYCHLDRAAVTRCGKAATTTRPARAHLIISVRGIGRHCFYVAARTTHGDWSPSTDYCWLIVGEPAAISIQGGSGQSTAVGSAFSSRLSVRVVDVKGSPVRGVRVHFAAPSLSLSSINASEGPRAQLESAGSSSSAEGRGVSVMLLAATSGPSGQFAACPQGNPSLSECTSSSDRGGIARSSTFTANGQVGSYIVIASIGAGGPGRSVKFHLTNHSATPPTTAATSLQSTTTTSPPATTAPPTSTSIPPSTTTTTTPPKAAFSISGSLSRPFYPGMSQSIDISFTNPTDRPITITSAGIEISLTTSKRRCSPTANFTVDPGQLGGITVPASATRSLSALGIDHARWPIVTMVETHVNQDACRNARLTFHYRGKSTS